jgi:hypothetical protein
MIAKRIPSPKGAGGFTQLGAYVLNAKGGDDPASWARLNAYVLDAGNDGEKVAWSRVTNCASEEPGWAIKEIVATQARNKRSRSDKNYHLVISFADGERPSRGQMEDIEDTICAAIGFGDHQRVSAVHQNTDHWHLHVAINKVHPTSFRNIEPFYDHYRLQACCAELEVKHGLIRTNHARGPDSPPRGRAGDFEAHQGASSFLRWIREKAGPALLDARTHGGGWRDFHIALARYGLVIKPRGAGLVIGHHRDTGLHVKASDVDRLLSMKALTQAWGSFEPVGERSPQMVPDAEYRRGGPPRAGDLYEAYQTEKQRAVRARADALARLRQGHQTHAEELRAWYRRRFHREKTSGLAGTLRSDAIQHLRTKQREDRAARIKREAKERRDVRDKHPIPTWEGYLENRASRGDEAALTALRGRARRRAQMETRLIEAADGETARHVILRHARPVVGRDGRVIYRIADGGVVSDEARAVRVDEVTMGASFLALSLAAARFGQRPLIVRGTDAFREQVAVLAGDKDLAVSFADPKLEARRVFASFERTKGVERGQGRGQ